MGSWEWNVAEERMTWSSELFRIFNHEPNLMTETRDAFLKPLHPDAHDRALAVMNEGLTSQNEYDVESRIVRPSGYVRDIHCRGPFDGMPMAVLSK